MLLLFIHLERILIRAFMESTMVRNVALQFVFLRRNNYNITEIHSQVNIHTNLQPIKQQQAHQNTVIKCKL